MISPNDQPDDKRHHLVVVGGGFGGLQCIKSLKGAGLRITLIDQRNHHLFQPLLYQAATTILAPSEIAWPLRQILRERRDVTTLLGEVTGVDSKSKSLTLKGGKTIGYDSLVLATGARHSYFGHDDWEADAPGLKTLEDATRIRRKILTAFEAAEAADNDADRAAHLTFAVIGAGPTGVELAGIIAELAHRILPQEFRRIDTTQARVMLIEAGTKVLPAFPDDLSDYTKATLTRLGVEVHLGNPVTACGPEAVEMGGEIIPCKTIIWGAGVQASPAAEWLKVAHDRAGRVMVNPDLAAPDHADVFVIGDTASVSDASGQPVPGIAPAAKQMGAHVARVLRARLFGKKDPGGFAYKHAGSLATLGRHAAIADFGRFKMKGRLAWWVWGVAHIFFLIGTRSRIAVAWSWFWSFVTAQNSARIIAFHQRDP